MRLILSWQNSRQTPDRVARCWHRPSVVVCGRFPRNHVDDGLSGLAIAELTDRQRLSMEKGSNAWSLGVAVIRSRQAFSLLTALVDWDRFS